jgi:hypothetical protein
MGILDPYQKNQASELNEHTRPRDNAMQFHHLCHIKERHLTLEYGSTHPLIINLCCQQGSAYPEKPAALGELTPTRLN